jgi:hypothetical protein
MKDAIKEKDEILDLSTNLRISAIEKMLHRLLAETKYSVASHDNINVQFVMLNLFLSSGKEKAAMSNNVFTSTSIDEEQEFQVSYLSRTIRNNHHKSCALYTI